MTTVTTDKKVQVKILRAIDQWDRYESKLLEWGYESLEKKVNDFLLTENPSYSRIQYKVRIIQTEPYREIHYAYIEYKV